MKRFLRALALFYTSIATAMLGQGTTGGLLYASDFANWSLPQGNTPMQGTIFYPNPDICKVTSNGYTFLAPKVGRPMTIVDGANTETFTPSSVVVNNNICMISGSMTHSHSSYSIKSGTAGAQEAIDYQASQPQGANVVLTPMWTAAGGTTGLITGTLKGSTSISILDQRTAVITPYTWNGSAYVGSPFGSANAVTGQFNGVIPLATGSTTIGAQAPLMGCSAGTTASCISQAQAANLPVLLGAGLTGSFAQYQYLPANANCSVNVQTGVLSIFPQSLGKGYVTPPTVTWILDTSSDNAGSLGTIVANLTGDQVTSYTVSGANSGWGPASSYFHGICPIIITVATPPVPPNPVKTVNQANGVFAFTPSVSPFDFGGVGDGVTDDTLAVNYAAQYAAKHGWPLFLGASNPNAAAPSWFLGSTTGYYVGGYDSGEVPIAATLSVTTDGNALTGCSVTSPGKWLKTTTITFGAGTSGTGGVVTATVNGTTHVISSCTASGGSGYGAGPVTAYSGPTCNSVPCSVLAPETPTQIPYSVQIPAGLVVVGGGATIVGGFSGTYVTATTYGNTWPYAAAFGQPGTSASFGNIATISDLTFKNTFIGIANPSSQWNVQRLIFNGVAIPIHLLNSQFDSWKDLYCASCMAGIVGGGQWLTRAPTTASFSSPQLPINNELDNLNVDGFNYHSYGFSSLAAFITARQALDCWFDVNFFHSYDQFASNSDNCPTLYGLGSTSVRITDQDLAAMWEPDSMWRGITGVQFALYSRYGYPFQNVRLTNSTDKLGQNYMVVSGPNGHMTIDNMNTESMLCNGAGSGTAVYGSVSCPNPYEPYSPQLPGYILLPFNDIGDDLKNLAGPSGTNSPGIVVHPIRDIAINNQNTSNRWPVHTPMNATSAGGSGANPLQQEGRRASWQPTINQYQNGTQMPSDSYVQDFPAVRFTTTNGTNLKESRWTVYGAEAYIPPSMPPTFLFEHNIGAGYDQAQVIMPGLKVNGALGIQGGQITGFTITNAGSGYSPYSYIHCSVAASSATIPGTAVAFQSDCAAWTGASGTVTNVVCTRCGQGYTSAPAVTIDAPSAGVTATATATIAGIDADNPIMHLSSCDFVLNAGGTITTSTTSTLSGITCNGAQFSALAELKDRPLVQKMSTNSGFGGLIVDAWVTAANTISVSLTNPTAADITYPAGTSTSPWHVLLENAGDIKWGINTVNVTPTITTVPYSPAGGGGSSATVYDFTTSAAASGIGCTGTNPYTCTGFPTGSHVCTVYAFGGGAGGGSGAVEASGTNAFGGGGGSAGGYQMRVMPCSVFGGGATATVTVTVGTGGNGGTAQSTNSTSGNAGSAGTNSVIAGGSGFINFNSGGNSSGGGGAGGTTTTGTAGTATSFGPAVICSGAAGASGNGGNTQCSSGTGSAGGSGGGGVNTTPSAGTGGGISNPSVQSAMVGTTGLTGSTGGAICSAGQTPAFSGDATNIIHFLGAFGGTGGGGCTTANGGTGGAGMFPGGGGGGGGAALNGFSSGAGGAGGNGLVRVIVQ